MADIDRLKAERDAALQVATTSFRDALTQQVYDKGHAVGSLAELAHVPHGDDLANFRIQYAIAGELRRWLVPPSQRPTCPLNDKPCTSWTCLVDVCVDETKEPT